MGTRPEARSRPAGGLRAAGPGRTSRRLPSAALGATLAASVARSGAAPDVLPCRRGLRRRACFILEPA